MKFLWVTNVKLLTTSYNFRTTVLIFTCKNLCILLYCYVHFILSHQNPMLKKVIQMWILDINYFEKITYFLKMKWTLERDINGHLVLHFPLYVFWFPEPMHNFEMCWNSEKKRSLNTLNFKKTRSLLSKLYQMYMS